MTLFSELPRQWTPLLPARELGRRPRGETLAGERVALFRDRQGRAHALLDRCPHRGVKLSLGRVDEAGCLECPYHGWSFAGDGACAHVPYNPDAKRTTLGATALPIEERAGLLWVFTAPAGEGELPPLVVAPELEDPKLVHWVWHEEWACHWTRAMENMLDYPHLPFVHRTTIGLGMRRSLRSTSRATLTVEPTDTGFRILTNIDGSEGAGLQWRRPNGMTLEIPAPGRLQQNIWCVPVDAGRTRMLVVSLRGFQTWNPLVKLFDQFNRVIIAQDRAVTESSDPVAVPRPSEEKSVATDRPTLMFRSWYLQNVEPYREATTLRTA